VVLVIFSWLFEQENIPQKRKTQRRKKILDPKILTFTLSFLLVNGN
jgi:hypothetical protein